ncbi:BT4734/BF3469 family protein [Cyclobacterium xiamenense]|uniref:BT4734/BF3469 family protein n=1 Tax=Cyclobacterium xiamenense TaxID=1297121 RepID=UPI0035CF9DFF
MSLSRKAILEKTYKGINIYAHVLRKYYSGERVLSISGKDCAPTKNPFNFGKPTLWIKIVDGCAVHVDTDNAIGYGDAFDFAGLHFKQSGYELLVTLDKELNLGIHERSLFTEQREVTYGQQKEEAANAIPKFSYFANPITNTIPSQNVNLLDVYNLIKSDAFADRTTALREIGDRSKARFFKASNFDYVTFSGSFSKRNEADLLQHSGLLALDFDHVENIQQLRNLLLEDPMIETELLFVSPSGDGIKWVVAADISEISHKDYFTAVANYVEHAYKLKVDQSGKDSCRACFLPHDPHVVINSKYLTQ